MVTVMARNGVNFGIRLSGTGDQWFQAPANPVDGLYFPGYTIEDAAADLGDSAITETNGLGGFAMAASPAIVQFVGGTPADATANSRRMLSITLGTNPAFTLPALNFGGTPAGIDARLVVDSGILPIINTGIAHKKAGVGQIGAGITTAPMECFSDALAALAQSAGANAVKRIAVVAFGGNALVTDAEHDSIPQQYDTVARTVPHLVDMIELGWRLVVSHGNGPQVGFILRRSEIAQSEVDPIPVDYAVADTQGAIGYMFVKGLTNELARRGINMPVVAVVTQSVVSRDDPAFANPTKPIGPFLDEAKAKEMAGRLGWTVMEDSGRGWRRTVPSPHPLKILETGVIQTLLDAGAVVVAAGGGGIPVAVEPDGSLVGVEAVVDKDLASGLLAHDLGADMLLIPTGVSRVAIHFGTPEERWLEKITVDEARAFIAAGEFGVGSMEPKVAAVADFVASTPGAVGVIGAPDELRAILEGTSGTRIVASSHAAVELAVNGTLMRGLKLNPNMVAAGAEFVREAQTEQAYRLWTIDDDHPAMVRVTDGSGVKVAVEIWSVPAQGLAGILLKEPPGLTIGKVRLDDGNTILGVIGELALVEGHKEISSYGGWRAYVASEGIPS